MEHNCNRRGPLTCVLGAVVLVALVAYVMSIGPAFCLLGEGTGFYGDVFRTVYAPLLWLCDYGPAAIEDWVWDYVLWCHQLDLIHRLDGGD